jgi:hypothetical protein
MQGRHPDVSRTDTHRTRTGVAVHVIPGRCWLGKCAACAGRDDNNALSDCDGINLRSCGASGPEQEQWWHNLRLKVSVCLRLLPHQVVSMVLSGLPGDPGPSLGRNRGSSPQKNIKPRVIQTTYLDKAWVSLPVVFNEWFSVVSTLLEVLDANPANRATGHPSPVPC